MVIKFYFILIVQTILPWVAFQQSFDMEAQDKQAYSAYTTGYFGLTNIQTIKHNLEFSVVNFVTFL